MQLLSDLAHTTFRHNSNSFTYYVIELKEKQNKKNKQKNKKRKNHNNSIIPQGQCMNRRHFGINRAFQYHNSFWSETHSCRRCSNYIFIIDLRRQMTMLVICSQCFKKAVSTSYLHIFIFFIFNTSLAII